MGVITDPSKLIFKNTTNHRGRKTAVSPKNSSLEELHYGRILLGAENNSTTFETGKCEVGLICVSGSCVVQVDSQRIELGTYDGLYVPRGSLVEVATCESVDLCEFSAEVSGDYPLQVVRFADVEDDPALHFFAGDATSRRELFVVIGRNVQAGKIVGGFTRSAPGNWTSWPPHEHAAMLEEMYVFFDMPAPAFGIQFVYTDPEAPQFIGAVRDGDAVIMPEGYHPNVAIPGHSINFLWLMAAHREIEDRKFGVVNVQPAFSAGGSGLEAGTK